MGMPSGIILILEYYNIKLWEHFWSKIFKLYLLALLLVSFENTARISDKSIQYWVSEEETRKIDISYHNKYVD